MSLPRTRDTVKSRAKTPVRGSDTPCSSCCPTALERHEEWGRVQTVKLKLKQKKVLTSTCVECRSYSHFLLLFHFFLPRQLPLLGTYATKPHSRPSKLSEHRHEDNGSRQKDTKRPPVSLSVIPKRKMCVHFPAIDTW